MRLEVIVIVGLTVLQPAIARGGYGFNCAGLLELTENERQWYLRGYLLASGMVVAELKSVIGDASYQRALSRHREWVATRTGPKRDVKEAVSARTDELASVAGWVDSTEKRLGKAAQDNLGFERLLLKTYKQPDEAWVGMFEMLPLVMQEMERGADSEWPMRDDVRRALERHQH
jgi:hypothetical protein